MTALTWAKQLGSGELEELTFNHGRPSTPRTWNAHSPRLSFMIQDITKLKKAFVTNSIWI